MTRLVLCTKYQSAHVVPLKQMWRVHVYYVFLKISLNSSQFAADTGETICSLQMRGVSGKINPIKSDLTHHHSRSSSYNLQLSSPFPL